MTNCKQLKLKSPKDEKKRLTDVVMTEQQTGKAVITAQNAV